MSFRDALPAVLEPRNTEFSTLARAVFMGSGLAGCARAPE